MNRNEKLEHYKNKQLYSDVEIDYILDLEYECADKIDKSIDGKSLNDEELKKIYTYIDSVLVSSLNPYIVLYSLYIKNFCIEEEIEWEDITDSFEISKK